MDPELEIDANEADVAEQNEEWTADPDDQPVVPDEERIESFESDDE
ncbi:MAG TPA: hypothetical protein VNZ66_09175 [Aeromicrobium sp.]|nr:hypothetical protein [Aeromicrobium sp.]